MNNTQIKELVTLLTEEQQQSLYEKIVRQTAGQQLEQEKIPQQYDIAIIGLSGRYPQSDNYYDFWHKLQQGRNFIQEVPANRWEHSEYYNQSEFPYKTRCKFGAFLKAHDKFDASFFDLHHDEVAFMDPQERIALETTWSCIEDAGYVPAKLSKNVGIFSGITYGEYQKLTPITSHSYMLNSRIAYFFDFQGPTVTTDAGCCSSLTAIHLACQSLNRKECQTAIVIGANIIMHPDHYTSLSTMLSSTTKPYSNPFGIDNGWIPAEGVVTILLKPLEKALHDGDHIYAVIKSSHICQEGKTSWFTASNPKQQAKLIQENFEKSGISPETISYVEAAANGLSLGDAIEINGLTTAFGQFTDKKQFCPIGSIKSYIGHGEGVSTLLQLTNVLRQFTSRTIFNSIHLKEINPNIQIENSPFYFPKSMQNWEPFVLEINEKEIPLPRRATISSFAAGGSIGHLILEERVPKVIEKQILDSYFIPISAPTIDQLQQTIETYIEFFKVYPTLDAEWEYNYTLFNIMFTLCNGRTPFEERVVFVTDQVERLTKQFHQFLCGESNSNIISKAKTAKNNTTIENNQVRVQSYLESKSWHDLAGIWVQGNDVSWETFFNVYNVQRVPLPTYCFQQQSFPIPKLLPFNLDENNYNTKIAVKVENDINGTSSNEENFKSEEPVLIIGQRANLTEAVYIDNESNAKLVKIFKEVFANAVNLPINQIDILTPLDKYDFNSVMVTQVAHELEVHFTKVPKTLFFECQTIQDVMRYFVREYPDEVGMIQEKEKSIDLGEMNQELGRPVQNQSNLDKLHNKVETNDSIEELTKAILSDRISAETVLKKL